VRVTVCDVGPRDGLQNEARTLPPETRAELVNRLVGAGVPRIEAVSFVNPARMPAMAGAEDVVDRITEWDRATLAGLVLNERGYERLAATPLHAAHFTFAATESFNERNANASIDESLAAAARIVARAHADDRRATVTISVAFGCPFEGAVPPAHVFRLAEEVAGTGADEIVFADTIGVAVPTQVRKVGPSGSICTTRGAPGSPMPTLRFRRERRSSTRPSAGLAVAPSRRRRRGTSRRRTSCISSTAKASRLGSTSTH
jgi:hydroxymethylglutaryl-CoA lyase